MLEKDLIPEDFDLEEFQEAVKRELTATFDYFPDFDLIDSDTPCQIDLSKGDQVVTTVKYERIPGPPAPPKSRLETILSRLFYDPTPLFAVAGALLIGFLLGGGNLLTSSISRNVVLGVSGFLISRAAYLAFENWRLRWKYKRRFEEREIKRRETEAKKRIALLAAGDILKQDTVKARICLALQDLSNSTFDYYKTVTAVLITFSVTGQLPVTLTPIVVAAVVVMLTKAGVKSYCEGDPK